MNWNDSFMVSGFIWGFVSTFVVLLVSMVVTMIGMRALDERKKRKNAAAKRAGSTSGRPIRSPYYNANHCRMQGREAIQGLPYKKRRGAAS